MIWWLGCYDSTTGAWVQFLVGELRSCRLNGMGKKIKKLNLKKDFPDGPVVKTPYSHTAGGTGSTPGWGSSRGHHSIAK